MYKAIVTDMDGTLLTTDKRISDGNKRALEQARDVGCQVVLCSGRSPKSMQRFVDRLGFRNPGEYYMGNHGGIVVDASSDQPIETYYLDPAKVRWFVEMGRKYSDRINVHLYQGDIFLIERRNASTDMYERLTALNAAVLVPDLVEYVDKEITKALFISDVPGLVLDLKEELKAQNMPKGMDLVASSAFLLEYADTEVNKGTAVKKLMDRMGIRMEEVICIGDSFNDISMIRAAGLGIAVSNAEDEVKENADYITESSNDEDAIAEVVRRFVV